ncbi:hypothetical protein PLESTB_000889300, partial [Pleodorina starrii]
TLVGVHHNTYLHKSCLLRLPKDTMSRSSGWRALALCAVLFAVCTIHGADAKRKKQQQTSAQVVNTVAFMDGGGSNPRRSQSMVVLRCREEFDPRDGFLKPEANCTIPDKPIVKGREAVEAFQRETKLLTGDTVSAVMDIRTNTDGQRRILAGGASDMSVSYRPGSLKVLERTAEKEVFTGQKINLRAIVYLLDFCGWKSPFRSAAEFRAHLFSNANGASEANMQRYYSTCSYGKAAFDPANVEIVGPITLECKGTYPIARVLTRPYDSTASCAWDAWGKLSDLKAQELAANNPALRTILQGTDKRRAIMIIPPEAPCSAGGLALVGCPQVCGITISTKGGFSPHTLYHEIQHTLGLVHASGFGDEYGDMTDPMGKPPTSTGGILCHNAPLNWRIGWAEPVANGYLTAARFRPEANRLNITIPASRNSDKNMVIVDLGLQSSAFRAPANTPSKYFISYRVRNAAFGGYDAGLPVAYDQKVLIHDYAGEITDRDQFGKVWFVDALPRVNAARQPLTDPWTSPFLPFDAATGQRGGLRVRVVSTSATAAVVEICRMYSLTEGARGSADCRANLDRDCDGLFGIADPDCK